MNGKRRISSQSKIPGRDDLSSRGRRTRSPIPIYFALLDSDCTGGGCILAKEDAHTMRAFSSPIQVRVRFHFLCLASSRPRCMMMDRHHASSASSASVIIGRALGALVQGRGQATRKDEGRSIRWHGTRLSSSLASEHLSASPPV